MSNVIDFLEKMGQDARLRYATGAEVELALESEHLNPELRVAIIAKDQSQLEALLGKGALCAFMVPAKEDEGDDDGDDEDAGETPAQDAEATVLRPAFCTLTKAS